MGFLLNSNKPIKSLQLEKLANQSIFIYDRNDSWEIYCKNIWPNVFETEFFVRVVRNQNQGYVSRKCIT